MSGYLYRSCRHCDRPMRPNGTRAVEHPGTVAHKARMLCSGCYNAGAAFDISTNGERMSIEATAAGLASYLRWRAPFRTAKDMT